MASFEDPADEGVWFGEDHIEGGIEELDFGGGLDGGEFGVTPELLPVGGVGDRFIGEGGADGDTFGDAGGDAVNEFDGDFGFGA
jgi:hypothetical protein